LEPKVVTPPPLPDTSAPELPSVDEPERAPPGAAPPETKAALFSDDPML